jgi:very-short-patch-repair endonuclease
LRKLRALGFPVRRQHPIGPYFADFAVERAKLVIEIDGGIHRLDDVRLRDAERQSAIEALGWKFMRVDTETAMSADHLWAMVTKELGL